MRFLLMIPALVILVAGLWGTIVVGRYLPKGPDDGDILATYTEKVAAEPVAERVSFSEHFKNGNIDESGSMRGSESADWWLNSGGWLGREGGEGMTIQGDLPAYSKWRLAYKISNPNDTDDGFHPQNIFRLVTRSRWKDFVQQVYFLVVKDNPSSSLQRNESNGLLVFNRYQDGRNLYYTGLRVDGGVVIKKKIDGQYHTMAYKKYFPGEYDRDKSPSLLPKNTWIGLRSEVTTAGDGVDIKIYLDVGRTGDWELVLEGKDSGTMFGSAPIKEKGFAGIRTDFMDVRFRDYQIVDRSEG